VAVNPGTILKNGAVVLFATREFVLAYWQDNDPPFVTWRYNAEGYTWHGNYFRSLSEAAKDLETR
jgi:hypothetical protein